MGALAWVMGGAGHRHRHDGELASQRALALVPATHPQGPAPLWLGVRGRWFEPSRLKQETFFTQYP